MQQAVVAFVDTFSPAEVQTSSQQHLLASAQSAPSSQMQGLTSITAKMPPSPRLAVAGHVNCNSHAV
jgi:hypothetical protein